jgi:hypothetical protein
MQAEHPQVVHRARTRESHVPRDDSSATPEVERGRKGSLDRESMQEVTV